MANPTIVQVKATEGTDPAAGKPDVTDIDPATGTVRVNPDKVEAEKAKGERPSWLPEKFKTPEDMAKAYGELEKKQSKPAESTTTQTDEQVRAAAAQAGIDLNALSNEYVTKSELSEETLKSLEAKGIKRETVNSYVEGQKALAKQLLDTIHTEVGGADNLTNMLSWAKANMTAAEISAYDTAVASGNAELAKLAVRGVHAKYAAAVGTDPKLVNANGVPGTGIKPFADSGEVIQAMRDKRYSTSSTYRAEVQARLAASDLFA